MRRVWTRSIFLALVIAGPNHAGLARDIKVLSSIAMKPVLDEVIGEFDKETGDKLSVDYGTANGLVARIEKGERFDVAILTPSAIDTIEKEGKSLPSTRRNIAQAAIGLAVRKGELFPGIATPDSFRQALRSASTIAYSKDGASGVYFLKMLGPELSEQLAPRFRPIEGPGVMQAVSSGQAQYGIQLVSEIVADPHVDLVGPFPSELQHYTVMTATMGVGAATLEVGRFFDYLQSEGVRKLITARGLEPM